MRILIIDDETFLVELAIKFLEMAGYKTQGFSEAEEALHWYRENHKEVDLVILDMKMPRMSGMVCFNKLREINPQARIALLSGYVEDETVRSLVQQGALKFFQKPLKYPELIEWISGVLQR